MMSWSTVRSLAHRCPIRSRPCVALLALALLFAAAGCTTIEPKERVRAGSSGSSLPPLGVVTFVDQRADLAGWKAVDAALQAQAGHVRSRVYLAVDDSVDHPLVHITTWENAGALAAALLEESAVWSAVESKGSSAIYGLSSDVGNIRDSLMSSVMIIVPFDTPADSACGRERLSPGGRVLPAAAGFRRLGAAPADRRRRRLRPRDPQPMGLASGSGRDHAR